MKRSTVVLYPNLFKYFSLFTWKPCAVCHDEFRCESGWRFITGPWHGGTGNELFLCKGCGKGSAEAATQVIESIQKPPRPPAPPPPPPPPRLIESHGIGR